MTPTIYRLPLTGDTVTLPWHLRARFGKEPDTLVMTMGDRCIACFPWGEWSKVMERLDAPKKERATPMIQAFVRTLLAPADKVDIDASGRVEISLVLRSYAGLDEAVEVVAVWDGRLLELWAPEIYRRRFMD